MLKKLSHREQEIVDLAAEGHTNEAIAIKLGISVGTVNTYWLRIKLKVGGLGRTDIVVNIFREKAETALREERVDWAGLEAILVKREIQDIVNEKNRDVEMLTALALLNLAVGKIQATVWATDRDLNVEMMANGELPSSRSGTEWEQGRSVYDLFKTTDKAHPAVAAHLEALSGAVSTQRLTGDFANMSLRVLPLPDESGDVIGCMSILSTTPDLQTLTAWS